MTAPYQAMTQTYGNPNAARPRGRMRAPEPQPMGQTRQQWEQGRAAYLANGGQDGGNPEKNVAPGQYAQYAQQLPQHGAPAAPYSAPGDSYPPPMSGQQPAGDTAPPSGGVTRYQGRMATNSAPPPTSVVTGQALPVAGGMVNSVGSANPAGAGRSGNPALDATYIGRSGGKMRWAGSDGKEYTNREREAATSARDDAMDYDMQAVQTGQLGGQLARQGGMQQGLDRSLANLDGAGQRIASWSPQFSMGFNPDELRRMTPTGNDGQTFDDLAGFGSENTAGVSTAALDTYDPTALRGVNTSALKGYNAGGVIRSMTGAGTAAAAPDIQAAQNGYNAAESVNTYARGAAGQARFVLDDALREADNRAAAGGRLDSGLFDRDRGLVIQNVGRDLNDKIATQAVQAAGIQAGIGNNNASLGTQANVARGNLAGNLMQSREGLRSAEARDAASIGADALTNALGIDQRVASDIDSNRLTAANYSTNARLNKAGTIDNNRLAGLDAASRLRLNQAQYGDTFRRDNVRDATDMTRQNNNYLDTANLNAANSYGDFSRGAADLYNTLNQNSFNNINDLAASERDRITGNRNAMAARNAQREQNKYGLIGAGIGLAGTVAGAMIGGPAGAAAGGSLGKKIGSTYSGRGAAMNGVV